MPKIPLELLNLHDDGFHLLVEVVIFGQKFKAVLDTGASKTVFDKTQIESLMAANQTLMISDRLSSGLGTTNMESFTVIIPKLKISKFLLKNFEAAVLDLSSINLAYEKMGLLSIIGVLGSDVLMKYNAQIDYRKLRLTLKK